MAYQRKARKAPRRSTGYSSRGRGSYGRRASGARKRSAGYRSRSSGSVVRIELVTPSLETASRSLYDGLPLTVTEKAKRAKF